MVVVVSSNCGGCVCCEERQGRKNNYLNELRNKDFVDFS